MAFISQVDYSFQDISIEPVELCPLPWRRFQCSLSRSKEEREGGAGRGKEGKGAGGGGGGGGEVEAIKRGNWFDGCRSEFRFIFLCVSRGHFLVGEITERNESNAMESNGIQLDFSLSPPPSLPPPGGVPADSESEPVA